MVPNKTNDTVRFMSAFQTLLTIFESLLITTKEKRVLIMEQRWDELVSVTQKQEDLTRSFEEIIKIVGIYFENNFNEESQNMKTLLKESIIRYKEEETLNVRLLKDAMFLTKHKVEKIYNIKQKTTYSKDIRKDESVWTGQPVILDRFV